VGSAPRLTGVRRARRGRVALELDGRPWRIVPDEVVVRCGLAPGLELDRARLRTLARQLRRAEALDAAVRVVARRDVSARRLRERLAARGVRTQEAESALAALASAGVVDDGRLAHRRAAWLAEKGWGDAAVEARLDGEGLPAEDVRAALAALEPEAARAVRIVEALDDPRTAWRLLARRGFAAEAIEDAVGAVDVSLPQRLP
jgi:regulatory protein